MRSTGECGVLARSSVEASDEGWRGMSIRSEEIIRGHRIRPITSSDPFISVLKESLPSVQVIPDRAALVVSHEYPSFRRLYQSYLDAADPEGMLANLRIGSKRLGPSLSKRVHHVVMASQDRAFESV